MKKILIIEDDESQAKTLLDYFNLLKYKTTITHSGEDGIKSLSKEKPDLIICDMILPGISGMNVLEMVRSKKGFELIPFIFLTAVKYKNTLRSAINSGADDYLTKPFTLSELENSITARINRVELIQKKIQEAKAKELQLQATINKLNAIIQHDVRGSIAKILSVREDIIEKLDDLALSSIILNSSATILKATDQSKRIPKTLNLEDTSTSGVKKAAAIEERVFKAIVVDDDSFYTQIIARFLSVYFPNVDVSRYSNPIDAIEQLKQTPSDLLTLDLRMPHLDGWQFLKELEIHHIKVPTIVHSSTTNPDEINRVRKFDNVKAYLGKPLKPELFKPQIIEILKNHFNES